MSKRPTTSKSGVIFLLLRSQTTTCIACDPGLNSNIVPVASEQLVRVSPNLRIDAIVLDHVIGFRFACVFH